jgi:asparagine synthase (glutamine-hydrolysing)
MCGIAGMAGVSDQPVLIDMLARIRHRGPDDSGTYAVKGDCTARRMAFGNNRLSIIDISPAGHQPMCNEDGTVWVAYNGDVFNFQELRQELERDGHRFRSQTDTEVLVHLYEKYGPDMVNALNGMFAFAIWDGRTDELWLFVDRMGIKPLYFFQAGERLYFASEIKALLACPEAKVRLNLPAVYEYLALTYVPNPNTLFEGIFKLAPGHSMRWRDGALEVRPYWSPGAEDYWTDSEAELTARLRALLFAATRRQLNSDVPLGFFLSGGIDSSTLVACAAPYQGRLRAYSIAFGGDHGRLEQSSDDARFARMVADRFGCVFHEIVVEPQVANLLPKVIYHLDDLICDHAAIATYLICQAAKPEVTVLLSGQGGDELFGGYRVHLAPRLAEATRRLAPKWLRNTAEKRWLPFLASHKDAVPGCSPGLVLAFCRYIEKLLRTAELDPPQQYCALRSYFEDQELKNLFSPDLQCEVAALSHISRFLEHFQAVEGQDFLNQMLYLDAKTFLPDHNLGYSDKLSMACSVEVRVPLIDNELVDFMARVPPRLKIRGVTQKYILRQAMKGILPDPILTRRKAGFGLPVRSWLRGELREMVGDLLSEERIRRRNLFSHTVVARMTRDNNNGNADYTAQIWGLLSLELWHQEFVDQSSTAHQQVCTAA